LHSRLRRIVVEHATLLVSILAILWQLRAFLDPHTLPARGDPSLPFQGNDLTPQWAPWIRVAIDAVWRHHTLPFWDPYRNAGSPEFEVPEAGVIGIATLFGGVLPLEAAIKWAMLAHVVIGMTGTYALARRLGVARVFAGFGAFSFGIGTYLLDHFRPGHLSHIQPMCLAPWAMFFVWRALTVEDAWWRSAVAGGVAAGLQLLEGGTSVVVYTAIAFSLIVVTCPGREWRRWTLHLARVAGVAATCAVATAAPQLLPMVAYIGVTGRGGGLPLSQSMAVVAEVRHPLPTVAASLVMLAGLGWLWWKQERRVAAWLTAMVVIGVAAARIDGVYEFLWRNFPGIRYQRIPQRALVLVGLAAPLLIAAGLEAVWTVANRWKRIGAVIAALAIAAFLRESWRIAPRTPPMADPRVEQRQNAAMRWLADHAAGSRVHVWESPNRQWGSDNITVPLGLEAITSYTPSEHRDYLPGDFDREEDVTFLSESYANPAKLWGLLNVRYVLSMTPRGDAGFTLAARVPRCPARVCQPEKSAGPYVYENREWLPRAWVVQHAIAVVGRSRAAFEAAMYAMAQGEFEPARVAVLQFEPGAILPPVDRVFAVDADVPGASPWNHDRLRAALARATERAPRRVQAAGFRRPSTNRLEFQAPADGWLVMSEKLALYRGWSATVGGTSSAIFRADGVLSAVRVGAGQVVRASYVPPQFPVGVIVLAVVSAVVVGADRWRRRHARRVSDVAISEAAYASPRATA
jgi:hypothetical protein